MSDRKCSKDSDNPYFMDDDIIIDIARIINRMKGID